MVWLRYDNQMLNLICWWWRKVNDLIFHLILVLQKNWFKHLNFFILLTAIFQGNVSHFYQFVISLYHISVGAALISNWISIHLTAMLRRFHCTAHYFSTFSNIVWHRPYELFTVRSFISFRFQTTICTHSVRFQTNTISAAGGPQYCKK